VRAGGASVRGTDSALQVAGGMWRMKRYFRLIGPFHGDLTCSQRVGSDALADGWRTRRTVLGRLLRSCGRAACCIQAVELEGGDTRRLQRQPRDIEDMDFQHWRIVDGVHDVGLERGTVALSRRW
jgi:hypothetical protein